jgi:hypothetical protein
VQTITAPPGSTWSQISATYKVSPDVLAKLNPDTFGPMGSPNALQAGAQINLPANIDPSQYTSPYAGDNAMTASNIQRHIDAGDYSAAADKGRAAARIAKDAALREAIFIRPGQGLLEGIDLAILPLSTMIDATDTVRKKKINESHGKNTRTVQLTENGVRMLAINIENIFEQAVNEARRNNYKREFSNAIGQTAGRTGKTAQQFAKDNPAATNAIRTGTGFQPNKQNLYFQDNVPANQQGGTVRNRPANANDPNAMAKNANPANLSSTAGPKGALPGGSSPKGNTLPYLAADPAGTYDTKSKGPFTSGISQAVEKGLGRFGNWVKDVYKDATTKVTANGLIRHWKDAGEPTDSDEVAKILTRLRVPQDVISQLYQQMNFPVPAVASQRKDLSARPAATPSGSVSPTMRTAQSTATRSAVPGTQPAAAQTRAPITLQDVLDALPMLPARDLVQVRDVLEPLLPASVSQPVKTKKSSTNRSKKNKFSTPAMGKYGTPTTMSTRTPAIPGAMGGMRTSWSQPATVAETRELKQFKKILDDIFKDSI